MGVNTFKNSLMGVPKSIFSVFSQSMSQMSWDLRPDVILDEGRILIKTRGEAPTNKTQIKNCEGLQENLHPVLPEEVWFKDEPPLSHLQLFQAVYVYNLLVFHIISSPLFQEP